MLPEWNSGIPDLPMLDIGNLVGTSCPDVEGVDSGIL